MSGLRIAVAITTLVAWALPAVAASPAPSGAVSCSGCHAVQPNASSPIPRLYGRDAGDIFSAMAAFRDGSRPGTVMTRIAKGFSDDEARAIAAWLAEQK